MKKAVVILVAKALLAACFGQTIEGRIELSMWTMAERARAEGKDRALSLPSVGVIPHIALGGPWNTHFTVVNTHETKPTKVEMAFWSSAGTRMVVELSTGTKVVEGNVFYIDLPPLATMRLTPVNLPSQVTTGYVELGYSMSGSPNVFAVFRARIPGRPDYEALVTPESSIHDVLLVPFDNRNGFGTAVAVANRWLSSSLVFAADILDENGKLLTSYRETLAPCSQAAFQTGERWPETKNRAGMIALRKMSGWGISALSLLFNPSGSVTTMPALNNSVF